MAKLYWLQMGLRLGNTLHDRHQLMTLAHIKPEVIEKLKGSAIIEVGTLPLVHYPLLAEYAIMFSEIDIETLADFYLANDTKILGIIDVGETHLQKIRDYVICDIMPNVRNK